MNKLKEYWAIILLALILMGATFYWFEIRAAVIRKDCIDVAMNDAREILKKRASADNKYENAASNDWYLKEDYEISYQNCMRKMGLAK